MQPVNIVWSRVVVVVIALTAAGLAYVNFQGPLSGQGTALADQTAAPQRSNLAGQVEASIARTNLAGRLEAALGAAFGGVWFDPSTAQLHVGATSPASQRDAEAVVAKAGLAGSVTETPVRSSWAQLEAVQEALSGHLADLFDHGEVMTALEADRNAVVVHLGSAVPPSRRAAVEDEAAAATVDVLVEVLPEPHLLAAKGARCVKFEAKFKAYCDPTIVAGVRIENEAGGSCTAGPSAILKDRSTKAKATATYQLTAGHCVEAGGAGKKWFAINKKEGPPKGKKELGVGGAFINGETDIGVIEVNTTYWAEANNPIPVVPTYAVWSTTEETEPQAVESAAVPVEGASTCFSGQRSGKSCGTVGTTDAEIKFEGEPVTTKNLVVLNLEEGSKGGKGDSGSPVYSTESNGVVQGVWVGFKPEKAGAEEGNIIYFHNMTTSFEKLEKEKGLALELLTKSNERRHAKLKAGKYPVTIHSTSTATQKFTTEAGSIECKESTFHAVLSEETSTLTVTPSYKGCKASFLGAEATVSMEECTYVFHLSGKASTDNFGSSMDISCPTGKSIKLTAATCKAEVKAQNGLEKLDVIDDTSASPKKDITARPTVTGIAYTVTQDGALCPFNGTGEKTGGEYTSTENITLTGQSTTEAAEKIEIEVTGG